MSLIPDDIDTAALPRAYDSRYAEAALAEWRVKIAELAAQDQALCAAAGHAATHRLFQAIAGNSPYLTQCILRDPVFFGKILSEPLAELHNALQAEVLDLIRQPPAVIDLMRRLRHAKMRLALLVAVADITGIWDLQAVTRSLSDFAAAAVQAAVARLLGNAYDSGELAPPAGAGDLAAQVARSGYSVLAMGKLGAHELNYSSDIDLIVLYDAEAAAYTGRKSMQDCFVRLTRDLVHILHERTAEGYVFRVDLRLRPDAGATPPALSMDAAENYYQSTGLNWERAAMIKARPIAGDIEAGLGFLQRIKAFVWRKHLDYAAVRDIEDIKTRIHSHHHHDGVVFAGQDVKLGFGGIREIEFFVQTFQLIMGGREFALRTPATLAALKVLADSGLVPRKEEAVLADAYRYLRRLEHRLQMVADEQTHELPETADGLTRIARFMGHDTADDLRAEVVPIMQGVHAIYAGLAQERGASGAPAEAEPGWHIFAEPEKAKGILETWLSGRYRSMRTDRARTILQSLSPAIVEALATVPDPDAALLRLDEFFSRLPAGVQLLSLFQAHPWLLELLVEIMGGAPALADWLGHNVLLLDAVLDAHFFDALRSESALAEELDAILDRAGYYEEILEVTRRWANDRKFQIGVQMLRRLVTARDAGRQLTRLAEVAMRALYPRVLAEFKRMHGSVEGDMAVLGLGKLGAGELTFQSDLDLIFLYESKSGMSDGPRPLPVSQYFTRLGQRYINAISAMTAAGRLFEVDMRLRPSGHAGPIAVGLDTFIDYQKARAWTWEHMALTRARCIVGEAALRRRVDAAVIDILHMPRRADTLLRHVAEMRLRLDAEFGTGDIWNLKFTRGGLLDIEFLIQHAILEAASEEKFVPPPRLPEALEALVGRGAFDAADGAVLRDALAFEQNVQSFIRLCCTGGFNEETAGPALQNSLARHCGEDSFDALKTRMLAAQEAVIMLYDRRIARPYEALGPQEPDSEETS